VSTCWRLPHSNTLASVAIALTSAVAATCKSGTEPALPLQVAFLVQPSTVEGQVPFDPVVQVILRDANGHTLNDPTEVTISLLENTVHARLEGDTAVAAIHGIAAFPGLRVDRPGEFVLEARLPGPVRTRSVAFSVHATFREGTSSAGEFYSCAITVVGFAYCWGLNGFHQLGDSQSNGQSTPAAVRGRLLFVQVSAGISHSCGLLADGSAYCWGDNGAGQLGDGGDSVRLFPSRVSGGLQFREITTAKFVQDPHTCAVTRDDYAYCWGSNYDGQAGDGTTSPHSAPTPVAGTLRFLEISAGAAHTCGVTVDSLAYCWGFNYEGQLGDSTTDDRHVPTPVIGSIRFLHIAAGGDHTCGIAVDGSAYCWGLNEGNLGDSTTTQRLAPRAAATTARFVSISAGGEFTCGVTTDGAVLCWGINNFGQLGDGTVMTRLVPTPVASTVSFTRVSAGFSHACGVSTGNIAYCWGSNSGGELGDSASAATSYVPTRVRQ